MVEALAEEEASMSGTEKSFAGADSISFPLVFQGPWHVRYTRSGVMVSSAFVIFFSHSKLITSFCQALMVRSVQVSSALTQGYPVIIVILPI